MLAPKMRPTFSFPTELNSLELIGRVRSLVSSQISDFHGRFTDRHAMISIAESKRHFWSPWLHLEVREIEGERFVWGRFSPNPSIWTGFMFSYLGLGVVSFFACIIGVSQRIVGELAWGFWLVPACTLIAGGLWLASQAGQKLAWAEMAQMKELVESVNCKPASQPNKPSG